ncbi:unnamed protein product [Fraxinus pennsylvanica]|uniref:Uncharacterized protein n=1 Tax=Fraxinus pennsylvanica TaxID=56036 RepID=A0AAD2AFG9_9LAMI|nr:unnamed protein product [Fraxinus pennsylvanica]
MLFVCHGFHLMDEIVYWGLMLVFTELMRSLRHRLCLLATYLRVVWHIPIMRIIIWCSKKLFYYFISLNDVLAFISVITLGISFEGHVLGRTLTFLQILFAITLDNYPGRFKLVVCSTISYIFGVLLFPETERNTNKVLPNLCQMVLLTTWTTVQEERSLKAFLAKDMPTREKKKEQKQSRIYFWCQSAFSFVGVGIFLSLNRFLSHAEFRNLNDPMCSAIFDVLTVILIAVLKRFIVSETTNNQLLNSHKSSPRIAPRMVECVPSLGF